MANGRLKNALGEIFYPSPFWPVGSIYISVNNINPSKWFGGTWVSFGTGCCLVGVDTSQTEFKSVEKTGGSKYLQQHKHDLSTGTLFADGTEFPAFSAIVREHSGTSVTKAYNVITTYAGTGNAGNLQPYITVYMWKRTA